MNQVKQVINMPVTSGTCNVAPSVHQGRILANMMCAGAMTGAGNPPIPQAVCQGDIGGALYCNNQVAGILAFGTGCGAANNPGVFMQVRLFSAWIDQQPRRTDTVAPGTIYPRV